MSRPRWTSAPWPCCAPTPRPRACLHLVVSRRGDTDSLFTGERLRAQVPDWLQADVWFCGPANFGDALQQDLVAHGLAPGHFQRELFEMR